MKGYKKSELSGGRVCQKKLQHVKGWLVVSEVGVDLLVDTGLTCNLMSTALCKKLLVVMCLKSGC